jgi:hypothetical protein
MQELSKIQLDATQIDLADRDSWENYLMLLETEQDLILSEIGYLEDEAVKLDKWIGVFDFFREEADRRLQEIRDADLKRTAYLMEHKIKQSD